MHLYKKTKSKDNESLIPIQLAISVLLKNYSTSQTFLSLHLLLPWAQKKKEKEKKKIPKSKPYFFFCIPPAQRSFI